MKETSISSTPSTANEDRAARPKPRHRAFKDELGRVADLRRAALAARGAKIRKPGGRYHAPEGRRARLRRNSGLLFVSRVADKDGTRGSRRGI